MKSLFAEILFGASVACVSAASAAPAGENMSKNPSEKKIAIVTGANRGLGFAAATDLAKKGYEVVVTARDVSKGQKAAEQIATISRKDKDPNTDPGDIHFLQLDVSDEGSIDKFVREFKSKFNRLDVLINNAGILIDDEEGGDTSVQKTTSKAILETFKTNTLGPFLITQKLFPLMQKNGYGRVVNLSSGMGQLSEMNSGYAAYRISKTAINTVTRIFANEAGGGDILVNSVCPGWVKTDMGGSGATRTLEQGVAGVIWAATLPKGGPNGQFFRDGKRMDW